MFNIMKQKLANTKHKKEFYTNYENYNEKHQIYL